VNLRSLTSKPWFWWTAAAVIAVCAFAAATNDDFYDITSPPSFAYYLVLRKLYSVVAFAAVGYPVGRALLAAGRSATPIVVGLFIAAFSTAIEIAQYVLDPPWEGLASNLFDVACGFAGGWIAGAIIARQFRATTR
jgi:hypothetical protein